MANSFAMFKLPDNPLSLCPATTIIPTRPSSSMDKRFYSFPFLVWPTLLQCSNFQIILSACALPRQSYPRDPLHPWIKDFILFPLGDKNRFLKLSIITFRFIIHNLFPSFLP
eukprot:TRINITY_DN22_c0_g2_i9.p1 TRINITY_DN22_c0_g2~~TRINITY_DN22_c0_g2_i9.p1  ORF type:complete len:112 (+),score=1.71 TRINITY_DN22_c0_g2_i9:467-802(+)